MLIVGCINIALQAQNFHVLDINNAKDGNPSNNGFNDQLQANDNIYGKLEYAVLNGIAYFTADDGIHGEELWRSDGTAAGTQMVKDIIPGSASSYVRHITVCGKRIFFRADDGISGMELWTSDGMESGTYMVKDISPFGPSTPTFLTNVDGTLYFIVNYYNIADQLWKSDGTSDGTVMVADLYSTFGAYNATQLTNVNGRLFFVLDYYAPELYTSDGTAEGTYLVKDINPFGGSNPSQLTAVNGLLCFAADDGSGKQLWVSDGMDAGTYKANNPNNIFVDDFYGTKFTIKGKSIYFPGIIQDGDGSRLCTYDVLNTAGIVRVIKKINPGFNSRNLYNITNVNGTLFFTVYNGFDQVLWKSDGTSAGTAQVKDINPGGRNIYLYKTFENADGTLIFSFYDDAHGYEVWKSDGTEAGTIMVKEINSGVYSSQAANITYIDNGISLFNATNGKTGLELWKTDGTEAGTTLVKNINKTTSGSSYPYAFTPTPDSSKLLFVASDPQYGTELRITDGTETGTHVVKDLFKGSFSSSPFLLINFQNKIWFFANILDTSNHTTSDVRTITKLCKTDGTKAGTKILSLPALEAFFVNQTGYVQALQAATDLLYMLLYNFSTSTFELWRTDGTDAGTYALLTNMPSYYTMSLKAVGDKLFFTNYDFTYGFELFVTDGTVAGTKLVKDIAPGFNNSYFFNFTAFKNKLYFADDYGYGPFLWSSDGTSAGTNLVKPSIITYSSFAQANDKLFFSAINKVGNGTELYANDGTKTYLVKDIYRGPGSSGIYNLTSGDTLVYFLADDGKHGTEIWKSNGTKHGTRLVKDITPDVGSTYTNNMITVHNQLFFTLNDILWQSDGTKNGTHEVNDANLANVTGLTFLQAFDNKLSFAAKEVSSGWELYIGDATNNASAANKATDNLITKPNTTLFNASLYPNPTSSKATLEISPKMTDVAVTISNMAGKIIWQRTFNNQSNINLLTEKLAAGMYMVTLRSGSQTITLKFIKTDQ